MNSYMSAHDYIRAVTGQFTALLIGNLMRVGGRGVVAGAGSLLVTSATTVDLNQYDPITIFDGSSTEMVQVGSATAAGATSIPLLTSTPLQFAHAAGVSCCSDGTQGSLAEVILEASANVERICYQPLLQATYTSELLPLQSTRAWIDSSRALTCRPRQFPVQSVSALSLVFNPQATMGLNLTYVQIDSSQRRVTSRVIQAQGANGNMTWLPTSLDQGLEGDVQISYVAGFAYSALPLAVKRACTWLVSDILSDTQNPTGAAVLAQGKRHQEIYLRGDLAGEPGLYKRARHELKPYTQTAA